MKKFFYNLLTVIAICVFLISLLSANNKSLLGFRIYRVVSGSMEPNIKIGDVIIIKKQKNYDIGDIVTYIGNDESFITHRIVLISGDEITTKGDANNTNDISINKQQIIGKLVLKIHSINFISYLLTKPVIWILVLFIGVFSILVFSNLKEDVKEAIKKRGQRRREKKRKE